MRYTRDEVLRLLASTTEDYLKTVSRVSDEDWGKKPSPGAWSVAEISEHVTTANRGVYRLLTCILLQHPLAPGAQTAIADEQLALAVADRSRLMVSPQPVMPRGRWATREEMMTVFRDSRDGIVAWAKESPADLRSFVAPHLIFGSLDGIQWILL